MAESAADARASLLRVGWQVIELRRTRRQTRGPSALINAWHRHLRHRRRGARAELFDGICSMLESGLPLVECLDVLSMEQNRWFARPRRVMLAQWQQAIRGGADPATAMGGCPGWFDAIDCAMVRSGQQGGTLPRVLEGMARREERADEVGHQLLAALTYPAFIAVAALGVVVFLSMKTLPELAGLLVAARLEVPGLTRGVMLAGQFIAQWGVAALPLGLPLLAGGAWARHAVVRGSARAARLATLSTPRVLRLRAVAQFAQVLADLLRAGTPAVEAMRAVAPTLSPGLARVVNQATDQIEQGSSLADALADPDWFSPQFVRVLHSAQAAGDVESALERLAQRDERAARRILASLTTSLEPIAILALAGLVGIVVIAAVLPLTRLQEVIQ